MAGDFFGEYGDTLSAGGNKELRERLERIDTSVPSRTQGRRVEHRERYCIVHYLRTLAHSGLLDYPFEIHKRERPDFRVRLGDRVIGLEMTEAGGRELQAARSELSKAPPGSLLEGEEIRARGERLQGRGYFGDEPERLWTRDVLNRIHDKDEKLESYDSFPEYHLVVYDNTGYSALTAWSVTELPGRLASALANARPSPSTRTFSRFSVLRQRVLMFDITGEALLLPVPPSPSLPPLLPLTRLGVDEQALVDFCHQHKIRKLGFFGSVREDRFGPDSDVDVLVEFEPDQRMGLLRLAGTELELTRLLSRKADLRTVPDLSRYFREEVVREKTDLAYVHAAG